MLAQLAPAPTQRRTTKKSAVAESAAQSQERTSVAVFDDLGLLVHDSDATDPADEVVFKMLQMKTLLASAFQLHGFERSVAIGQDQQNLIVEFQRQERRYEGFKR